MLIVVLLYTSLASYLALNKPTSFVVFYLASKSKFLGFFDPETFFVIGGLDLSSPLLNAIALLSALVYLGKQRIPKNVLIFIACFFLFILYGVVTPILAGAQGILVSLIASKEYFSIVLFVYLAINREKINVEKLLNALKFLGIAISLSYIVNLISGFSAPYYSSNEVFRAFYPTFISLSLFIFFYEMLSAKINSNMFLLWFIILTSGLLLSGHESLFYSSFFCIFALFLVLKHRKSLVNKTLTVLFIAFSLLIFSIVFSEVTSSLHTRFSDVVTGKDAALTSRAIYNEFRWNAINDQKMGGYGFVHHTSMIVDQYKIIENNRFAESFSVIDSGYVDLLIKFGYIGSAIYLFLFFYIIYKAIIKNRNKDLLKASMAFYLLQYYIVNVTWSVWSFSHGLVPGFVALFLIMRKVSHENVSKVDTK